MYFKILTLYIIVIFLNDTALLSQCPWEGLVNPTNQSGVFQGQATVNELPLYPDDWVAAFDGEGNCAGATQITIVENVSYINLSIYGDDGTSQNIDEGINGGEEFYLKLWLSSVDTVVEYGESFHCWYNNNGAPMVGCGDIDTVYNFINNELAINNLIAYKVTLNDNYPNPSNTGTTITFEVNLYGKIMLDIIDINGDLINRLIQSNYSPGVYSVYWNGEKESGKKIASGLYFYRLSYYKNNLNETLTKKMMIFK